MEYRARDIMTRNVVAVPTTMDLRDLAKLFLEKGITGAPVVDKDGALAGVISQTDLVYYNLTRGDELVFDSHFYETARVEGQHISSGFQFEDFNTASVSDVMTPVVHSVSETASIQAVARLMTRKHIHRVIVRKGRAVSGIISALDVLRVLRSPSDRTSKSDSRPRVRSRAGTRKKGPARKAGLERRAAAR